MSHSTTPAATSAPPPGANAGAVTRLLDAAGRGEAAAAEQLLPLVYGELRRLAAQQLARERPGQTLQATALVHEAYLRLVGTDPDRPWDGRRHFFAAAAEAMRRILVERARRRARLRHGGGRGHVPLDPEGLDLAAPAPLPDDRLLALDAVLDRFAAEDPDKAQPVRLRFFTGLTLEQAAELLGISRATAARHWSYARARLYDAIEHDSTDGSPPDREKTPGA
jgi:RNA polymerase sigma factor (TIGR02999 family)